MAEKRGAAKKGGAAAPEASPSNPTP